MASPALTKLSIANSPETKDSTRARNSIASVRTAVNAGSTPEQARAANNMQPTVSADTLVNPPPKVEPPIPQVNTNDGSRTQGIIDNVTTNTQGFIQSESENAKRRDELASLMGDQTFDSAGQRTQLNEQYNVPANLTRLTDIQTQLTKANTASDVQKTQIANAAGQTLGQAQREVTQQDRENAVRNAGLAAEAAVLQGSIETASTLINQAMSDFYQDRTLKNQNMIQQLDYFSGLADGETKQLIEKEQRVYEEEQKKIDRVIENVDTAMSSGAATGEEIRLLTDPNTTDEDRLALSQGIIARGAKSLYDAELYGKYLSNAVKQKELDVLNTPPDPTVLPKETLKTINDLSDGQRTAITGSRETVNEINRMISLVETTGDVSLLTKATEEGREFLRLRQNVVDKLARNRTGAVVGADEEKTFKDILGVGWFDVMVKDDTEIIEGLKKFRTLHEETLNLNDPTGEVRSYLDSTKVQDTDPVIQAVWGVPSGTPVTTPNSYY